MTKIRFSAGHGKGREYNRGGVLFNEGDENYNFTTLLISELLKYDVDVREIRHERGNKDFELYERADYGKGADLFYSAHSNAADDKTATGVEIFLSYQSLAYYNFAKELTEVIAKTLNIRNRGVKFKNYNTGEYETYSDASSKKLNWYGELRGNKAKCAMLVEHFFHTNKEDSQSYLQKRELLAKEITKLIAKHFKLKIKNSNTSKPSATTSKGDVMYKVQVGAFKNKENAEKLVKELKAKGYNPIIVNTGTTQKTNTTPKKSNTEVAKEVLNGKWGNGTDRKNRLTKAGYNYKTIQDLVNKLI